MPNIGTAIITEKQKRAVQAMVENGWIISKAMITAWYSKNTAHCPHKMTQTSWYKALLAQYWLTEELIITALVEDIKMKPQNRKPELELWAKIWWMLIDRVEQTTEVHIKDFTRLSNEELQKLIWN